MSEYRHAATMALAGYRMFLHGLRGLATTLMPNGQITARAARQLQSEGLRQWQGLVHGVAATLTATGSERADSATAEVARIALRNITDTRRQQSAPRLVLDGAPGLLAAQKALDPTTLYTAKDSAGRRWNAAQLVDFLLRDFAYQSEIDEAIAQMRSRAIAQVRVTHPVGNHHTGRVLTLDELEAQRGLIFHPNSQSFLEPADEPVQAQP